MHREAKATPPERYNPQMRAAQIGTAKRPAVETVEPGFSELPLDTLSTVSTLPEYRGVKNKWDCLEFQRQYSPNKAQKLCGLVPLGTSEAFRVGITKVKGEKAKFTNRKLCKSFWCPYCSGVFRADKREMIKTGLNNAIKAGKFIYFVTFTIPKGTGTTKDKFDALNGTIRALWNRLRNKIKRDKNKLWTIRGTDVTINDSEVNPIHLHTHSILILDREIDQLYRWIWKRYDSLMDKVGFKVSELAFDLQRVKTNNQIDAYLVKNWNTLDRELTSTDKLSKKEGSLGWFKWLSKIKNNPTERQVRIYKHFLISSKGRRTFDLSRNFEELLRLYEDKEDLDDFEHTETEDKIKYNVLLSSNLWKAIVRTRSEPLILTIIDKFIDVGQLSREFRFVTGIIEEHDPFETNCDAKLKFYVDALNGLRYGYGY